MPRWSPFAVPASNDQVSPSETRPASRAEWIGWGVLGLLALFHVFAVLGASLRGGRLSVTPTYDDVAYLVEGLLHLDALESGGFRKLMVSFAHEPPHAPLNTLLATTGFALVPGNRLGAYLMDGIWVFLTLYLGVLLLRPAPRLMMAGLLTALLAIPIMGLVVSEFRPDLSWGLLTGFVSLILLTTDLTRLSWRRAMFLGMLVGLDVLSKPTGFLPVLANLGTAYVVSVVARYTESSFRLTDLARPTMILAVTAAAVTIPYYGYAWNDLVIYIRNVMFTDRDVWVTEHRALGDELIYFFDQSRTALGWLTSWAPLATVAWLARIVSQRPVSRSALVRAVGALLVMAVSYAVATISPVKTFFFGCIYYGTVIAASMWALANLLQSFRVKPILAMIAGLAVFAVCWSPRSHIFLSNSAAIQATDQADNAIAPAVIKYLSAQDRTQPPPLVMGLAPGPVFIHVLQYYALLADVPGLFIMRDPGSYDDLTRAVTEADVSVISQKGATGQSPANFRVKPYLDQVIKALQDDPAWRVIASYTDKAGFQTFAFARADKASAAGH